MSPPFEADDLARLESAGIAEEEARRQLELLRHPPPPARLLRPAIVGDGVLRLGPERLAELEQLGRAARDAGRLAKFVPASGAASRMFRALAAVRERGLAGDGRRLADAAAAGDADAEAALRFARELPRTALAPPLAAELGIPLDELSRRAPDAPLEPLLAALLDPDRLDADDRPKALLPFHRDGDRVITAFEEQLAEGLPYLADRDGVARHHFTVPPGRRSEFEGLLAVTGERLAGSGLRLEVGFSEQSPATDTLALDEDGRPARDSAGRLLLRPSGHGALLGNLAATGGDLVFVKNIDNVLPRSRHAEIARWKLVLAGLAVETERRSGGILRALAAGELDGETLEEARAWVEQTFGHSLPAGGGEELARALERALRRPLRVCGVVPSSGEPGGGPFWTAGGDGRESLQIVEFSQVDAGDPGQLGVWRSSTHFNPVDLVAGLRDPAGRAWPLERFVDPAGAFVTRKGAGGRTLTVLERPGLWNGSMAGWLSRFVEVPGETFAPVKTVLDLARPAHATTP